MISASRTGVRPVPISSHNLLLGDILAGKNVAVEQPLLDIRVGMVAQIGLFDDHINRSP
jgi:hypothetical protein